MAKKEDKAPNGQVLIDYASEVKRIKDALSAADKMRFEQYLQMRNGRLSVMFDAHKEDTNEQLKTYWVGVLDKKLKSSQPNERANRKLSDSYYNDNETEQLQDALLRYFIAEMRLKVICEYRGKDFNKLVENNKGNVKEVEREERKLRKELGFDTETEKKDKSSFIID